MGILCDCMRSGGNSMETSATTVNDMLDTLEKEDYEMAISYIRFLSDARKKARVKKAALAMDEFQNIIGSDKGWDSEADMLADMAEFRKERMGL